MKIETRKIADLKPAGYNPRRISDQALAGLTESIKRFGLVEPIIVNERTGHVVGGHQRLKALVKLKQKDTQVVVVDVDEAEEKVMNLSLNNPFIQGEYTEDVHAMLRDLEQKIKDELGLMELELSLAARAEPGAGLTDPDAVPEVAEPITKLGDLWLLGPHRVLCGDCTEETQVKRLMGERKADIILTDPPYGMNLDTDWSGIRKTEKSLSMAKNIKGKSYTAVIGDDKSFNPIPMLNLWDKDVKEIFLFGADYYAERIPNRGTGSWLVWDKRKESQDEGFGSSFELIWSKEKHQRKILRHEWFGFLKEGERGKKRVHPTQKPVLLIKDILSQWMKGNLVHDPFLGSGTTLIAAHQLDRVCYGMEISPRYCDIIIKRWEDYTGLKASLSPTGSDAPTGS